MLFDGRRATPSTLTGAVDANMLPSALIKRIDVVTGGASAAWGSDAVAGVINFVLDREFTGIKGEIQGGISGEGDGENYPPNSAPVRPSRMVAATSWFRAGTAKWKVPIFAIVIGSRRTRRSEPCVRRGGTTPILSSPWSTVDRSANGHVPSGALCRPLL